MNHGEKGISAMESEAAVDDQFDFVIGPFEVSVGQTIEAEEPEDAVAVFAQKGVRKGSSRVLRQSFRRTWQPPFGP